MGFGWLGHAVSYFHQQKCSNVHRAADAVFSKACSVKVGLDPGIFGSQHLTSMESKALTGLQALKGSSAAMHCLRRPSSKQMSGLIVVTYIFTGSSSYGKADLFYS